MNDSYDNKLVKAKSNTITRYSNALIRRAFDDLTISLSEVIQQDNKKKKILMLSDPAEGITSFFDKIFKGEGFDVTFIAPYNRLELVYNELLQNHYDMVIPTNLVCSRIIELVEEIKRRIPQIKIIVLSGYMSAIYIAQLKACGVNVILTLPFHADVLLHSLRNELSLTNDKTVSLLFLPGNEPSYRDIYDELGFKALLANDPEELENIVINNNIDLAIEHQTFALFNQSNYNAQNIMKKIGKVVPVFLYLCYDNRAPNNIHELYYVDTLKSPFNKDEMRNKFIKMLTREKQDIMKKMIFWTY